MPVGVVGSERTSRPIPEALSFMMVSFSGVIFVFDVKVSVILISKNDNVDDNNTRKTAGTAIYVVYVVSQIERLRTKVA
jgi:hypothetical protein